MARYDLGLNEQEFWSSTLYELSLLMERAAADLKFRAACAGAKVEDEPKEQTAEQQFLAFKAYSDAHNKVSRGR